MSEKLYQHTLENGLILLAQPMDNVESASFHFLLPSGAAQMPVGCAGAGMVLSDWLYRGAGAYDSRQLVDALDGLGLDRGSGVSADHAYHTASMESGNLFAALDLYADVLLRPRLEPAQFEPSRQSAFQDLEGLDDDPRHKVMLSLREQFYPDPLGRPAMGKMDDLKNLTAPRAETIYRDTYDWSHAIFSAAGKVDPDALFAHMEKWFRQAPVRPPVEAPLTPGARGYRHEPNQGSQVHIGLMTEMPPISSKDYYRIMAAVSVLSGGMSSRLFTEVREKRGLCYAVGARYHTLRDIAGISCYAGTTPEKAQETLDVTLGEFERLREGIRPEELHRAQVGLKSSLIMQNESTSSRAAALVSDQFLLGRIRPLEEIREAIEALTVPSVEAFLTDNPFRDYTIVTIGPTGVEINKK